MAIQAGWRWCKKCMVMFVSGGTTACPGGGAHDGSSSNLYFAYTNVNVDGGLSATACTKCQTVLFKGYWTQNSLSIGSPSFLCPAGQAHSIPDQLQYVLLTNVTERPQYSSVFQHRFRYCSKCMALVYCENSPGICPNDGGAHRVEAGDTLVLYTNDPTQAVFQTAADIEANAGVVLKPTSLPSTIQDNWLACRKCRALFYAGGASQCAAGGAHDGTGSASYCVYHDLTLSCTQANWRWCNKCQSMFYSTTATGGVCKGGGAHDSTGSGNYTMLVNINEQDQFQRVFNHQWRWCSKCQSLFYGATDGGVCPAGDTHHMGTQADYILLYYTPSQTTNFLTAAALSANIATINRPSPTPVPQSALPATVQGGWAWCHLCQALFYSGVPSVCPCSSSGHDAAGSGAYCLYANLVLDCVEKNWHWCKKCSGIFYSASGLQDGMCQSGGTHDGTASGAYTILNSIAEQPAYSSVFQHSWRACSKCKLLFFGDSGGGSCPGGGTHAKAANSDTDYILLAWNPAAQDAFNTAASLSANRSLVLGMPLVRPTQAQWRQCKNCQTVSYIGNGSSGCPFNGGNHDYTGSTPYLMYHDVSGSDVLGGWRWCNKCQGMFAARGEVQNGVCIKGGMHDTAGSGHYYLRYNATDTPDVQAAYKHHFRRCAKCQLLFFGDVANPSGSCPATGSHVADDTNTDYAMLLAQPHIEAQCKLIVDYDQNHAPNSRFDVVLIPRGADGKVISNTNPDTDINITVYASDPLTITKESNGVYTPMAIDGLTPAVFAIPVTGRVRFSIVPTPGMLTLPVLKARFDGMDANHFSIIATDIDLHTMLANLTGSQMTTIPKGKTQSLMSPAQQSDANALAGAVSQIMQQCLVNNYTTISESNALSFADGDDAAPPQVLTPVSFAHQESATKFGRIAPTVSVAPAASIRRQLCRRPQSAANADSAVQQVEAAATNEPQNFGVDIFGPIQRVAEQTWNGVRGTIQGTTNNIISKAEQAKNTITSVQSAIQSGVGGAANTMAQVFNTVGPIAQTLITNASAAIERPVADFTQNTIANATQLAIDTTNGLVVLATVVENNVTVFVKTAIVFVEDAAMAAIAFCKRVGLFVELIIEILAGLFDWDAILDIQAQIQQQLDTSFSSVSTIVDSHKQHLNQMFTATDDWLAGVNPGNNAASSPSLLPVDPSSIGGPFGYLMDKVVSHFGSSFGIDPMVLAGGLIADYAQPITQVTALDLQNLSTSLNSQVIKNLLQNPEQLASLSPQSLYDLVTPIAKQVITVLKQTFDSTLSIGAGIIGWLKTALQARFDLGLCSFLITFIEQVIFRGRQTLSVESLLTLGAAALVHMIESLSGIVSGALSFLEPESFLDEEKARNADYAVIGIAAFAGILGAVVSGVSLKAKVPEGMRLAQTANAIVGLISAFALVPYKTTSPDILTPEQWITWYLGYCAGIVSLIDVCSAPTGGESEDLSGYALLSTGIGLLIAWVAIGCDSAAIHLDKGDKGRDVLDLATQLSTAMVACSGMPQKCGATFGILGGLGLLATGVSTIWYIRTFPDRELG